MLFLTLEFSSKNKYKTHNGTWSRERANIRVEVTGSFFDEGCIFDETKNDSRQRNNQKKVQEKVNKAASNYHMNDDVNTEHRMIENGVTIEFANWLNMCN